MRSLRAALTGDVHGPDLIASWILLHQEGRDRVRLQEVLSLSIRRSGKPPVSNPGMK